MLRGANLMPEGTVVDSIKQVVGLVLSDGVLVDLIGRVDGLKIIDS